MSWRSVKDEETYGQFEVKAMARGTWKGMRDQRAVMRHWDADESLVWAARQAGVLETHWSPSGEAYFADDDVRRFGDFLEEIRQELGDAETRSSSAKARALRKKPSKVFYRDARGHALELWLCESCGRAIDRSGHCLGCSGHTRGA